MHFRVGRSGSGETIEELTEQFNHERMVAWTRLVPEGKEGFGTYFRRKLRGFDDGLNEEGEDSRMTLRLRLSKGMNVGTTY